MHLHAKGRRASRHRLTDPAHAKDAKATPADPSTQQCRRCPALPVAPLHDRETFGDATGHGKDQRHRHVRRIVGQHTRRIRHQYPALTRRGHVDMIDPRAVIGDQLEPVTRLRDQRRVDFIGDGRHEHIRALCRLYQFGTRHRLVGFA